MSDPRIGTDAAEALPGSFGSDMVIGLGGNDIIDGNAGSDTLSGNAGDDTVFGGLNNDFVIGGRNADILRGDDGNDTIYGNKGNDSIEGGSGDDVIFGGRANDVIDAGSGNDVIWGDLGADSLVGGTGADVFVLTSTSGGDTIAEADKIADFTPGLDLIGLASDIELSSLNVTLQPIAGSSSTVNVILQDLVSGTVLATIERVSRSEFTSNNIFTQVVTASETIDIDDVAPDPDTDTTDPTDTPTVNTTTRDSVGKSSPITGNTTVVTFENLDYTFSSNDFSFFDVDGDPFTSVRIATVPDRGSLVLSSITTDATSGATTTTNTAVAAGSDITVANLTSLKFVPEANTQASPYSSFSFQVNDSDGPSNTATASIFVRDISELPVTGTNTLPPFIAETTTAVTADEKIATQLTNTIAIVEDSGFIESATIAITGGGTAATTGEDTLAAPTTLPAGVTANYDAASRTLTLTGRASSADYQAALRGVTYRNSQDFPQTAARTVSVVLNDGLQNSATQSYALTVNDTPDNTQPQVGTTAPASSGSVPQNTNATTILVSTIVGASTINATDAQQAQAALGIVVTDATDNQGGAWEYSSDGGTTWTAIGGVSDASALVLKNTDLVRLNNPTTIGDATLKVRAWDTTDGLTTGNAVNVTNDLATKGLTSAYSAATADVKFDAITGAVDRTLQAEGATLSGNYNVNGTFIQVNGAGGSTGAAEFTFPGTSTVTGTYDITLFFDDNPNGSPNVSFTHTPAATGITTTLASWSMTPTALSGANGYGPPQNAGLLGVTIAGGDTLTFNGRRTDLDRSLLDSIFFDLV
ncbi:MAG: calcium-binding protein [Geitlerinemataceae cyanobacterium]